MVQKRSIGSEGGDRKRIKTEEAHEEVSSGLNIQRDDSVSFDSSRRQIVGDCKLPKKGGKCVIYWMSRDQRVQDNWAMLYARQLSNDLKVPLRVCFCLVPSYLGATIRHYGFMLKGLEEVEQELSTMNIPFTMLMGQAKERLPSFVDEVNAAAVVCDFSPVRIAHQWRLKAAEKLTQKELPLYMVDAHNVVPCWVASDKKEYGARTIRNKINTKLPKYLTEFPTMTAPKAQGNSAIEGTDWKSVWKSIKVDEDVKEVEWCTPGTKAGLKALETFIRKRLKIYGEHRNDPLRNALSNMSPYYHFGHVSVARACIEVKKTKNPNASAYFEESIVRRELADNFCYYEPNYDNLDGAHGWARETLEAHRHDPREYVYTYDELAQGQTHDKLWNAAQLQMSKHGKMHGFLRMYWAKKILEWTESPDQALQFAIRLNDRFELDGRDPNGYVGCAWSIMGTHDQGWAERPIFGKIRYMNYNGCKRKFDVTKFENAFPSKSSAAKQAQERAKKISSSKKKQK
eukprot:Clim_evm8s99 gene=Clim_evmTU8s99